MKMRALVSSLGLVLILTASDAPAQSDNFNDGDDFGWTQYDPLAGVPGGQPSTFSFPSGGYRIQAGPSPAAAFGPARAGSNRLDTSYADFVVSVDVVNWDNTLDQVFGITGRIRETGLGTTDGYGLIFFNQNNELLIDRFDDEDDIELSATSLALDPALDYRFVFRGTGDEFLGEVFDLTNLSVPLATIFASDATYPTGSSGLLVASDGPAGTPGDATFDNFLVTVPEPSAGLAILFAGGLLMRRAGRR
jgi:hypothetical protein